MKLGRLDGRVGPVARDDAHAHVRRPPFAKHEHPSAARPRAARRRSLRLAAVVARARVAICAPVASARPGPVGLGVGRAKPQRRVGNAQHVLEPRRRHGHRRRHSGAQLQLWIGNLDHRRIRHHARGRRRAVTKLRHGPAKPLALKRIDPRLDRHALAHPPDVCLVDVRHHAHSREVLRDDEHRRRLQARGDGLPRIDLPRDHQPRHRSVDLRLREQIARARQGRLRTRELCERHVDRRPRQVTSPERGVDLGLRVEPARAKVPRSSEVSLSDQQVGPRPSERCTRAGLGRARLVDPGLKRVWVELGQQLPLAHGLIEIRVHSKDAARGLRSDLHLQERLHGARRLDALDDLAHGQPRRHVANLRGLGPFHPPPDRGAAGHDEQHQRHPAPGKPLLRDLREQLGVSRRRPWWTAGRARERRNIAGCSHR